MIWRMVVIPGFAPRWARFSEGRNVDEIAWPCTMTSHTVTHVLVSGYQVLPLTQPLPPGGVDPRFRRGALEVLDGSESWPPEMRALAERLSRAKTGL